MGIKKCTLCEMTFPATTKYFYKYNGAKKHNDGLRYSCKKCDKLRADAYRKKNKEKHAAAKKVYQRAHKDKMRNWRLMWKYGIDSEEYDRILRSQNGVCAICEQPETHLSHGRIVHLSVDHDHDTGKVRGVLCNACNKGLGHFRDDVKLLKTAIRYINANRNL